MTLIEDKKGRPASILGYFRNKTKNAIFSYLECPCGWYVIICYIYMYIIVKNMTYLILKKLSALSVKYFCYCATLTLVESDFLFRLWVYEILWFVCRPNLGVSSKQHWMWGIPLQTDLPGKKSGGRGAGGSQQLAMDGTW